MNDNRPVNLDLSTIRLPLPAYVSILHRISGVVAFVGVIILLGLLDASLASEESFKSTVEFVDSFFVGLIIWGVAAAVIYHSVAGVKHLLMDMGIGESLEGGLQGAKVVFGVSAVLILIVGLWIW